MRRVLRPERSAGGSVHGIFQRGHKIFLAFPPEFFLGGFEAGDAACDFITRACEALFLVGHCPSFVSRPIAIGGPDWGANAETALQDCGCAHDAIAVDKKRALLVAFALPR
jgi:hypothetical protein